MENCDSFVEICVDEGKTGFREISRVLADVYGSKTHEDAVDIGTVRYDTT